MKFYIEPLNEMANAIISQFLSLRNDSIDLKNTTMKDSNFKKHSVYITEDHGLITFLKKSITIKINKDFKIYILKGDLLVLSYIDHKKK